jgi:hypothetical protein
MRMRGLKALCSLFFATSAFAAPYIDSDQPVYYDFTCVQTLLRDIYTMQCLGGGTGNGSVTSVTIVAQPGVTASPSPAPSASPGVTTIVLSNSPSQHLTGTTPNVNWALSNVFYITLSGNTTFTFSNQSDAQTITIAITNTASNYTVTWPSGIKWTGGSSNVPIETIGAVTDVYQFIDVAGTIYGTVVQNEF